jgi:hypothetical protein
LDLDGFPVIWRVEDAFCRNVAMPLPRWRPAVRRTDQFVM